MTITIHIGLWLLPVLITAGAAIFLYENDRIEQKIRHPNFYRLGRSETFRQHMPVVLYLVLLAWFFYLIDLA